MIEHVAASTLVSLIALAAALAMRRQRAAWRHAILLAAVLRFALPTAWLVGVGSRLAAHLPPGLQGLDGLAPLLLHPGTVGAVARVSAMGSGTPWWLLAWAIPAALSFALWARGAMRPIAAVRPVTPEEAEMFPGVPLRIVAADHVPGACGIWRQHVILPDGLAQHLTPPEMRALVAHEMAHVRRRDNLWAAIVHAIVSAFWFDPVLWWTERRMLAERETACDEAVLRQGVAAQDYVTGIAKVCRMSFAARSGYAGVTGANLHRRMEHIMNADFRRGSSRMLRAVAGAGIAVAMLLPLAGGFVRAQSPAQTRPDPDFERGLQKLKEKAYDDAYDAFRRSYQADPKSTRGILGMVETLMEQKRTDEAIALLHGVTKADPANRALSLAYGNILVRAGRNEEAVAVFRDVLTTPGDAGDVHLRMGEAYRRMGNLSAAIEELTTARELMPDNVTAVVTLALVYDAAGKRDQAAQLYRETLRLNPDNGVASNNLAYLLVESGGSVDEALQLALRANRLLADNLEVKDTLGWVYLKKKNSDLAIDTFRATVEGAVSNQFFRAHLAMALDQKGDTSATVTELKSLLRAASSPANDARIQELLPALGR